MFYRYLCRVVWLSACITEKIVHQIWTEYYGVIIHNDTIPRIYHIPQIRHNSNPPKTAATETVRLSVDENYIPSYI